MQLYHLWMNTQAPAILQSDNGTEFCAEMVEQLCAAFGVELIHGSVGHPESQGAVERCNRSVKDKIRAQLMLAPTVAWGFHVGMAA